MFGCITVTDASLGDCERGGVLYLRIHVVGRIEHIARKNITEGGTYYVQHQESELFQFLPSERLWIQRPDSGHL